MEDTIIGSGIIEIPNSLTIFSKNHNDYERCQHKKKFTKYQKYNFNLKVESLKVKNKYLVLEIEDQNKLKDKFIFYIYLKENVPLLFTGGANYYKKPLKCLIYKKIYLEIPQNTYFYELTKSLFPNTIKISNNKLSIEFPNKNTSCDYLQTFLIHGYQNYMSNYLSGINNNIPNIPNRFQPKLPNERLQSSIEYLILKLVNAMTVRDISTGTTNQNLLPSLYKYFNHNKKLTQEDIKHFKNLAIYMNFDNKSNDIYIQTKLNGLVEPIIQLLEKMNDINIRIKKYHLYLQTIQDKGVINDISFYKELAKTNIYYKMLLEGFLFHIENLNINFIKNISNIFNEMILLIHNQTTTNKNYSSYNLCFQILLNEYLKYLNENTNNIKLGGKRLKYNKPIWKQNTLVEFNSFKNKNFYNYNNETSTYSNIITKSTQLNYPPDPINELYHKIKEIIQSFNKKEEEYKKLPNNKKKENKNKNFKDARNSINNLINKYESFFIDKRDEIPLDSTIKLKPLNKEKKENFIKNIKVAIQNTRELVEKINLS